MKWQTTECYIKGEAIRRLLSVILFMFYALIFIGEVAWWMSNVRNWKKCYRLVQYLPIESASSFVRDKTLTDLHLILAMVELNGSRQKVSPKFVTNFYLFDRQSTWCTKYYQHWTAMKSKTFYLYFLK